MYILITKYVKCKSDSDTSMTTMPMLQLAQWLVWMTENDAVGQNSQYCCNNQAGIIKDLDPCNRCETEGQVTEDSVLLSGF